MAENPIIVSRFIIEIDKQAMGYFTDVSGLQAEIDVFLYEEGGENSHVHKLPGRAKFSNVTLKRGVVSTDNNFWQWIYGAMYGQIQRRPVSIRMLNQDYTDVRRWDLEGAYPVKWSLSDFKASDSAVAIETLELAHNGFVPQ